MIERNKGFTLIELIIVVATLIILSAIAIPSFFTALSTSEAAACATNRRSAVSILQTKIILDEIEQSELNIEFQTMGITCPAHGSLHAKYDHVTQMISVECTKHTETRTQGTLNKFKEMCENFTDYIHYENNDIIREKMFEQQNYTWSSIGFHGDDQNYYIQPYWNTDSKEMYIFASSSNTTDGGWNTEYIYNADTATWYHGNKFSIVNKNEIHNWNDVWEKMNANGWEPVTVEYEK